MKLPDVQNKDEIAARLTIAASILWSKEYKIEGGHPFSEEPIVVADSALVIFQNIRESLEKGREVS